MGQGRGLDRDRVDCQIAISFYFDDGTRRDVSLESIIATPFHVVYTREFPTFRYAEPPPPYRLTVHRHPSVKNVGVGCGSGDCQVQKVSGDANAGIVSLFDVRPNTLRALGDFTAFFDVVSDDPGQSERPAKESIHVSGRIAGDVTWSPERVVLIDAGAHPAKSEIRVTPTHDVKLIGLEIVSSPDFVAAESKWPAEAAVILSPTEHATVGSVVSGIVVLSAKVDSRAETLYVQVPVTVHRAARAEQ